ncbi:MAG: ABC transporter ATP-binding protein, partial [Pseudonocardia sp.]
MLEIEGLSAGYGQVRILHEVSVRIDAGEIVAILGSNGAGKTTLFRALFGFADVTAGSLRFGELDLRGTPAFEIAKAGLVHVPEGRGLFPGMTVLENLMVPVQADRGRLQDRRDMVFEIFPRLKDRLGQAAGTMSGGEQQMLA